MVVGRGADDRYLRPSCRVHSLDRAQAVSHVGGVADDAVRKVVEIPPDEEL